ncbi:hypothetical protein [Plastoroseomonas arctica]|uniref:DUF2589 domain-containing protein n=1 Tax=Plastoroseomonas arctica TaxID=1509237 RepID=A0AAF1K5W0_9PROT|nr:hypothetical protein [Plastoroseomonas arctica]MBR0657005.1 hypothetical protein [Plastoroseomonas arctica]
MAIGQELLDIPFADMVRNLAAAVAEGQLSLDQSSMATLQFLADEANGIAIIPEIIETIAPAKLNTTANGQPVEIDTVSVTSVPSPPVKMTLLQAGIVPTFYQFTEASIEVKLSISMKRTGPQETNARPGFVNRTVMAFGSPVNFRSANTFSYTAEGSSVLRVTMKPVPPPVRLLPDIVSVNATLTPPSVTRTTR